VGGGGGGGTGPQRGSAGAQPAAEPRNDLRLQSGTPREAQEACSHSELRYLFLGLRVDTSRPSLRTNWTRLVPFLRRAGSSVRCLAARRRTAARSLSCSAPRQAPSRQLRRPRTLISSNAPGPLARSRPFLSARGGGGGSPGSGGIRPAVPGMLHGDPRALGARRGAAGRGRGCRRGGGTPHHHGSARRLGAGRPAPPPPSRTKWTRLVHPSVLIGHVPPLRAPGALRRRRGAQATGKRPARRSRRAGGAQASLSVRARVDRRVDDVRCSDACRPTPPPPSRTKWTRLVHPSVLIGHVSSLCPQ